MRILSQEDINNRLSPISDECIDDLRLMVENEDDEDAFIKSASAYIRIIRKAESHKSEPAAQAQKRIDRVKNAFDKLTEQDKLFLDINTTDSDDYPSKRPYVCESIHRALDTPVHYRGNDLALEFLSAFARLAIRKKWIDVTVDSNALTAALKIMIEEAGGKHNATVIASKAKKAIKTP